MKSTRANLVPADLDDVHYKIARALESLRQGKALDGEAVMAELLGEFDSPRSTR